MTISSPVLLSRERPLVFDFDGVLCDASTECALVTWNSHFGLSVAAFAAGVAPIPDLFLRRFGELRGYSRHLGHFLVALLSGADEIADQRQFDELFASLPDATVARFCRAAEAYRGAVRTTMRRRWLEQHRLYDGVVELLRDPRPAATHWYVVTAKDVDSVVEILRAHDVPIDPGRVYGSSTDKNAALRDIAQRNGVESDHVVFLDDNVVNVVAARTGGYDARWASWGFGTNEHIELAYRLDLPQLSLAELAGAMRHASESVTSVTSVTS